MRMSARTHEKKKKAIAKRWWIEVADPDLPRRFAEWPCITIAISMRIYQPVRNQPASHIASQITTS
jgi:hypothetical protein